MSDVIKATWSKEQVDGLNRMQADRRFHPYTCPNHHEPYSDRILVATPDGWRCKACDYKQDWARELPPQGDEQ